MQTIGKWILCAAAVAVASQTTPSVTAQESTGHRIAVVDVAKIFKEHPGIKAQVEAVEGSLKRYDEELKGKKAEFDAAAKKLKAFEVNSREYTAQEELLAEMDSKLRLDMARKRKELADAEAKIYYENYLLIAEAVEILAKHNKINLVLRYNNEDMDLEKGDTVVRGVMRAIVYHDPGLDMTPTIMQMLDKKIAAGSPAVNR